MVSKRTEFLVLDRAVDVKVRDSRIVDRQFAWTARARQHLPSVFIAGAVILGGAGSHNPLIGLVVTALALAVVAMARDRLWCAVCDPVDRIAVVLCAAMLAIMLGQLVPLPPAVWQHLPGRSIVSTIDAAQSRQVWRPLSLAPDLTLDMILALIAPVVAFALGRTLPPAERLQAMRIVVGCAMAAALLGIAQLATGADGGLTIWTTIHTGSGVGWFVNRNHQAAFLLIAIVFAGVPGAMPLEATMKQARLGTIESGVAVGAMLVLLAAGVLATLSRTGVALLPLALILAMGLRLRARHLALVVLAIALFATGLLVLANSAIGDTLLSRYGLAGVDGRFGFWTNTWLAARTYWPIGTGFGSFVGIYQMVEPLDQVGTAYVVHAHDDYLEWLLEGGLPIAAIVVAATACMAVRLKRLLREPARRERGHQGRKIAQAALGAMLLLALASLTDFPLRMAALGVAFGLCAGFAANPRTARRTPPADAESATGRRTWIWQAAAGMLALGALCAAMSQDRVLAQDGAGAVAWDGWRARGWSLRGLARWQQGHQIAAATDAAEALRIDPLDPLAMRLAGLIAQARGQVQRAGLFADVAGQLGWRDLPTQAWLADRADRQGNIVYEVQRVDALIRQQIGADQGLDFLVGMTGNADGRTQIVARLADSPGWAQGFFNRLADQAAAEPDAVIALVDQAQRARVAMTPDTLAQVTAHLAEAGQVDAIRTIRRTLGANPDLGDGDFASATGRLPDQPTPYRWRGNPASGGEVYIGQAGDGHDHALHVVSDGHSVMQALRQRLVLLPGRYRLQARLTAVDGGAGIRLQWTLRCIAAIPGGATSDGATTNGIVSVGVPLGIFVIPPQCNQQELQLDVISVHGQPFHAALQHVAIDSERQHEAGNGRGWGDTWTKLPAPKQT